MRIVLAIVVCIASAAVSGRGAPENSQNDYFLYSQSVGAAKPASDGILGTITGVDLAEARRPQPPTELRAAPGRKDLDFRGDSLQLFESVARAFGLEAVFDGDYKPAPMIRFRLDNADYREALTALQAATASFVTPVSERVFLVAKDTPQKRSDLELTTTVVVDLPAPVKVQDAQEAARAVQQAMTVTRLTVDSQQRRVLFRDRVSKVRPAQQLFLQLMRYPALVSIEVELLETSRSAETNYGLSWPSTFPLVYFGDWLGSEPTVPAGFTKFLTFGGGKTLFGIGVTDAAMFANMSRSLGRTVLRAEILSSDGQPASLHVGERYPVQTGGYLDTITEVAAASPQITYYDLGLVVKVTPKVHGAGEVTLDVETEYEMLTGAKIEEMPVLANRQMKSQIRLRNGEWAVVAGIAQASKSRTTSGLAGLSALPILGHLFREVQHIESVQDLLIVLKPVLLSLPPDQQKTRAVWAGAENRPVVPL